MLDLHKLDIFAVVAAEGSFSRAAERLTMSQPAVSQHMRDLEAGLSVELFVREHRGVSLTPAGVTLLDYSKCLLRLAAEAESAVANYHEVTDGTLRIGASGGPGTYLLPEWLHSFHERHPQLALSIATGTTAESVAAVKRGEVELAIVEGERVDHTAVHTLILQDVESLVVVHPAHPWASRETIPLGDLATEPLIAPAPDTEGGDWLRGSLGGHGVQPRIVAELDGMEAIKKAVRARLGIAVLPHCAIRDELADGALVARPLSDALIGRTLKLVWSRVLPLKPTARAFITFLADIYPQVVNVIGEGKGLGLYLDLIQQEGRIGPRCDP